MTATAPSATPAGPATRPTARLFAAIRDGAGPAPIRWASRQLLPRIGTVFQEPEHQLLATTVRDELAIGPRALGGGSIQALASHSMTCNTVRQEPSDVLPSLFCGLTPFC